MTKEQREFFRLLEMFAAQGYRDGVGCRRCHAKHREEEHRDV